MRSFSLRQARAASTVAACLAAVLSAYCLVRVYGKGSPEPRRIDGFGVIEEPKLPLDARRLDQIVSLEYRVDAADDFIRVYLNNYLMSSSEGCDEQPPAIGCMKLNNPVDRKIHQVPYRTTGDMRGYLHKGLNVVIAEIENFYGPCAGRIDLIVNGKPFYTTGDFPETRAADQSVASSEVFSILQTKGRGTGTDFVLCGRKAVAFWVE